MLIVTWPAHAVSTSYKHGKLGVQLLHEYARRIAGDLRRAILLLESIEASTAKSPCEALLAM